MQTLTQPPHPLGGYGDPHNVTGDPHNITRYPHSVTLPHSNVALALAFLWHADYPSFITLLLNLHSKDKPVHFLSALLPQTKYLNTYIIMLTT